MRRFLIITIAVLLLCGFLFAQGGISTQSSVLSAQEHSALGSNADSLSEQKDEKKLINIKADFASPIKSGDSIWYFLGNFAAQHNGAVITCDSAVSYSDTHYEFFGNVLINQNTTYIYGDRADYNGDINLAEVFSPIIKVVDGDATLYTYKFKYDTKNSIGVFDDGGVLINRENKLEAIRGYYYSDSKQVIFVDEVEMRNNEYDLKGDSVIYNMVTDNAKYFRNTNIWNFDGDYLYADRGLYIKLDTLHFITENGYVLTEKDELWSDSLYYYTSNEHIIMHNNIQIDDTEHKTLVFGDYGEYWKNPGNMLVTRRPSIVNYDIEQGDSVFMRGDTIQLLTINSQVEKRYAERMARLDSLATVDSVIMARNDISMPPSDPQIKGDLSKSDALLSNLIKGGLSSDAIKGDSLALTGNDVEVDTLAVIDNSIKVDSMKIDSIKADSMQVDSIKIDSTKVEIEQLSDTLTVKERRAKLREIAKEEKRVEKEIKAKERKIELDKLAGERQKRATANLLAEEEKRSEAIKKRKLKAESKLKSRIARAARRGKTIDVDSTELKHMDSLLLQNIAQQEALAKNLADTLDVVDSTSTAVYDSLAMDSLAMDSLAMDSLAAPIILEDSISRLIKAYRNVKVFRTDVQNVCDSLVSISTDSTTHLYINPVLWNLESQITSDIMDIFTANQQIIRAEFIGKPIMASRIDSVQYNQVAGKKITSFFRENEIYKNDVDGNAQTIYFMQDDDTKEVTGVAIIESGSTTFYIDNRQVTGITYRQNPEWKMYPMNKLPADVSLNLDGFKWQGDRRPTRNEVFDRYRRPSEKEERILLEKPEFPFEKGLNRDKESLLESETWSDRTDLVLPETIEWMRSLGYEVGQPRKKQSDEDVDMGVGVDSTNVDDNIGANITTLSEG